MRVKIAVFGRKEIMDRIIELVDERNDLEIIPFTYVNVKDLNALIDKALMCDIYLFAGALPYLYAYEKINKKRLPFVQVIFDEYMILTSLYRLKNDLKRFSIDVSDHVHVNKVVGELEMDEKEIYTFEFGKESDITIDKIVKHHHDLWNEGKIDHALTSMDEVEQRLSKLEIPASCMTIPNLNLEHAIDQAASTVRLNQSKSPQIVSGHVRIQHLEAITKEKGASAANELLLKLHHMLLKFGRKTDSSVLSNHNQFVLFGTRSLQDHITKHYRDFPLIREIEETLETPVDIGFGLGLTAKQAEDHAKLALDRGEQTEISNCYIVNDRQDTIGPLGIKKQFDTTRLYHSLIHKAQLNNELSYNFLDFITVRNNEPFSSNDIASYYNVTKRSAERTINKLLSGEVIIAVGEEKPYARGRPRKLFTLNQ
ncbi:hypothetical protein KFZ58_17520 [Virgibacillus sp. NKC19-16]|uniref:hypothetical protein n=1 Tax=Virgibacillus salidurans TaxID=2831673 RepID=UPI001F35FCA2|nr:hypothetical protein [Virgibacillus sp. NKC19-16]UJL46136.1 hypothetical protein KFZ58_17520 [Virgibacillus sp. NKC19-16]